MAGQLDAVMECLEDLQKMGLEDLFGSMGNLAFLKSTEVEGSRKQKAPKDPLTKVERRERRKLNRSELSPKLVLEQKRKAYRDLPVLVLEEHRKLSHALRSPGSGLSVCISVTSNQLAVAGDQGNIQLFDLDGKRLKVLNHSKKAEIGYATCLSYCEDGSLLAAGHVNGSLVLWDVAQGVPLCSAFTTERSPLLQVKLFREGKMRGFYSNSEGTVAEFSYLRSMFFDMEMLRHPLDLEEAGVCTAIAPLPESKRQHPLNPSQIVAFGLSSAVLVYSFAPKKCLCARIDVSQAPYLCWSWYNSDPILGLGYFTSIALYQLRPYFKSGLTCIGHYMLPSEIRGLHLTPCGKVLAIDNYRDFHVLAPRLFSQDPHVPEAKQSLLQVVKYGHDLHNSKLLANGGEYYQNSTALLDSQLYLLGDRRIYKGLVLGWAEIGRRLMAKDSWLDGFAFAMDLYAERQETALDLAEFRQFAREITLAYMQVKVLKWENKLPIVVEFCLFVEETDYLLGELSQIFLEQDENQSYLNCLQRALEPYILHNYLRAVPALVLGKIMACYINESNTDAIEAIILHLDAKSLDMSAVRPYCEEYGLVTAEIYLSTHAAEADFLHPVVFICKAMEKQPKKRTKLGRKLMWYLRMSLAGYMFPSGQMSPEVHSRVFRQLIDWLAAKENLKLLVSVDIAASLELLWTLFANPKLVLKLSTACDVSHSSLLLNLHQISPADSLTCISIFIGKAAKQVPLHFDLSLRLAKHLLTSTLTDTISKPLEQALVFDSSEQVETELESCIIAVLETCKTIEKAELEELIRLGAETRL